MKKRCQMRIAALLTAGAMLLPGAGPVWADGAEDRFARPELSLPCRAALLMDRDTGTVLYEKEADTPMPMASITKVMTLLLTFEALETGKVSLEDQVPVSEHAYEMGGSQIWLEPGEIFDLDEMLRAICVASANDAAVAVAEFIGGSEEAFVESMNRRAGELGLTNTHYRNACGLDAPEHYSTARDIAVLSREMLTKHPGITDYTTIWTDTLREGATHLVNTNKLLKRYPGVNGLKTGTTGGAGVCITASAERDGLGLIAVVLGSPSGQERFRAAATLLDYGFANFEAAGLPREPEVPQQLPIRRGTAEAVPLCCTLPESFLLLKGEGSSLHSRAVLPRALRAPVTEGQEVGKVEVYAGETLLGEYPIKTENSVNERTILSALDLLWQAVRLA